nr:ThuA domain-containing protein [Streptomyces sp. NRRL S-646]
MARYGFSCGADESSYGEGGMGEDHPPAWCREQGSGGREFYTALGHAAQAYDDAGFCVHLLGGINWAAAGLA